MVLVFKMKMGRWMMRPLTQKNEIQSDTTTHLDLSITQTTEHTSGHWALKVTLQHFLGTLLPHTSMFLELSFFTSAFQLVQDTWCIPPTYRFCSLPTDTILESGTNIHAQLFWHSFKINNTKSCNFLFKTKEVLTMQHTMKQTLAQPNEKIPV